MLVNWDEYTQLVPTQVYHVLQRVMNEDGIHVSTSDMKAWHGAKKEEVLLLVAFGIFFIRLHSELVVASFFQLPLSVRRRMDFLQTLPEYPL